MPVLLPHSYRCALVPSRTAACAQLRLESSPASPAVARPCSVGFAAAPFVFAHSSVRKTLRPRSPACKTPLSRGCQTLVPSGSGLTGEGALPKYPVVASEAQILYHPIRGRQFLLLLLAPNRIGFVGLAKACDSHTRCRTPKPAGRAGSSGARAPSVSALVVKYRLLSPHYPGVCMSERVSRREAVGLSGRPRRLLPMAAGWPDLEPRGNLEGSRYLLKGSRHRWCQRLECAMSRLGRARETRGMRRA